MARRENQGMQIAMILFIITTLVFMLTTYLAYSAMTRLAGEVEDLNSKVATANNSARSAETLAATLKEKIGLDAAMADGEATQQVEQAVAKNAFAPENQTFLGIVDELNKRVTELSTNLARANQDNQKLRQEKQAAIALEQTKLAAARENEAKAQAGFSEAVKEKEDYFATNKVNNDKYLAQAQKAKADAIAAKRDADKLVSAANAQVKRKDNIIQDRTKTIQEMTTDTPDKYDGRVLGVVAATKTVLLNIGQADGLRPKMVLGIYDSDDSNVRTATRKASVEVTKVLGAHTAEARITETDYRHPIIRDDLVFSATWSPGETLGVALLGKMDIDKDGLDDRDYIRNLISLSGGRVDAEDVDGQIRGGVTVNTRYIVIGDAEFTTEDNEARALLNQSEDLAIEQMSVSELLDLMGYAGRSRAITYDGVLRPGDFAAEREGVLRSTPTSTKFRSRRPLTRRTSPKY